jgi:heme exporter protein B
MKPGSPSAAFTAVLRRDLTAYVRRRSEALNPLLFAAMVATLFPLALGPEADKLARVASGVVWVTVLLSGLLSLDGLFRSDAEDGSLDQLLSSGQPPALISAAKILAHWLAAGLPLTLLAPALAALLGMPHQAGWVLASSLLLGTPLLSLIGAACAALTVGLSRSGILLALLVLPLTVPVLIFGAGAVEASISGGNPLPPLEFLAAGLAAALPLAPLACAVALRLNLR